MKKEKIAKNCLLGQVDQPRPLFFGPTRSRPLRANLWIGPARSKDQVRFCVDGPGRYFSIFSIFKNHTKKTCNTLFFHILEKPKNQSHLAPRKNSDQGPGPKAQGPD